MRQLQIAGRTRQWMGSSLACRMRLQLEQPVSEARRIMRGLLLIYMGLAIDIYKGWGRK